MKFVERTVRGRKQYFIDGRQVEEREFVKAIEKGRGERTLAESISGAQPSRKRHESRGYPIKSVALAVTRKRIPEQMKRDAERGVPTEYTKNGRPILRDAAHRKAYLKAYGYHDRNSFNGY